MSETLIIIIVMLAVIGSIMILKPSPLQRKQNQFRAKAIAANVSVKYVKPEHPIANGKANILAYSKITQKKSENPLVYKRKSDSFTLPESASDVLHKMFNQLPDTVTTVERTSNSWVVYWDETGTLDDLNEIIQVLRLLQ